MQELARRTASLVQETYYFRCRIIAVYDERKGAV